MNIPQLRPQACHAVEDGEPRLRPAVPWRGGDCGKIEGGIQRGMGIRGICGAPIYRWGLAVFSENRQRPGLRYA